MSNPNRSTPFHPYFSRFFEKFGKKSSNICRRFQDACLDYLVCHEEAFKPLYIGLWLVQRWGR